MNQAPASDPESSWQVRHKGKTLKALMGPSAAFAGDHVELSDGGDDFASTVGIGAIVSTKFTWPARSETQGLLPAHAASAKRCGASGSRSTTSGCCRAGTYRGELYDIGFDKPETHVVEKSGRLYYAFYAPQLARAGGAARARRRRATGCATISMIGNWAKSPPSRNVLHLAFERFMVLEAIPGLMAPPIERGLLIEERRRRICELLREHGRVTVDALAARFGTSQVTIRADLSHA